MELWFISLGKYPLKNCAYWISSLFPFICKNCIRKSDPSILFLGRILQPVTFLLFHEFWYRQYIQSRRYCLHYSCLYHGIRGVWKNHVSCIWWHSLWVLCFRGLLLCKDIYQNRPHRDISGIYLYIWCHRGFRWQKDFILFITKILRNLCKDKIFKEQV